MSRAGPAGEVEVAGPVLPADYRQWKSTHPDLWDEVEERIAIMVYDAKMSADRAERAAVQIVRELHARRS